MPRYSQYKKQADSPMSAFARGFQGEENKRKGEADALKRLEQTEELKLKYDPKKWIQKKIADKADSGAPLSPKEQKTYDAMVGVKEQTSYGSSGMTQLSRNKLLGTLQSGQAINAFGVPLPLNTTDQALDYILSSGYTNYEQDPEIMQVLQDLGIKEESDIQAAEAERIADEAGKGGGIGGAIKSFLGGFGKADPEQTKYNQADLEHTAQKHGISVEEVIKRLGG